MVHLSAIADNHFRQTRPAVETRRSLANVVSGTTVHPFFGLPDSSLLAKWIAIDESIGED